MGAFGEGLLQGYSFGRGIREGKDRRRKQKAEADRMEREEQEARARAGGWGGLAGIFDEIMGVGGPGTLGSPRAGGIGGVQIGRAPEGNILWTDFAPGYDPTARSRDIAWDKPGRAPEGSILWTDFAPGHGPTTRLQDITWDKLGKTGLLDTIADQRLKAKAPAPRPKKAVAAAIEAAATDRQMGGAPAAPAVPLGLGARGGVGRGTLADAVADLQTGGGLPLAPRSTAAALARADRVRAGALPLLTSPAGAAPLGDSIRVPLGGPPSRGGPLPPPASGGPGPTTRAFPVDEQLPPVEVIEDVVQEAQATGDPGLWDQVVEWLGGLLPDQGSLGDSIRVPLGGPPSRGGPLPPPASGDLPPLAAEEWNPRVHIPIPPAEEWNPRVHIPIP